MASVSAQCPGSNLSRTGIAPASPRGRWTDENPRSTGILVRFGLFSFLDLGDLTKPKEVALVCPNNPIGEVSLYLVDHHGLDQSSAKAFVYAIHPRAAIMDNGAHKGGSPEAWQTVNESVGSQNLYMLHTAEGSDRGITVPRQTSRIRPGTATATTLRLLRMAMAASA